jgi:hypothetical protein
MNIVPFFRAIKTRLEADTGTGGLYKVGSVLVTGTYSVIAVPNATTYPYLLIDHEADEVLDGFDLNYIARSFRVHVWANLSAGLDAANNICDRVYGDGNRTPTYGLHRHTLAFVAGSWTGGVIEYRDTVIDPDEDHYHFIQRYVVRMSRTAS